MYCDQHFNMIKTKLYCILKTLSNSISLINSSIFNLQHCCVGHEDNNIGPLLYLFCHLTLLFLLYVVLSILTGGLDVSGDINHNGSRVHLIVMAQ